MTRDAIATTGAPAAIGPYSQAIAMDGLVFCSGQLGLDPATGNLVEGVEAQAERSMQNLAAVLAAAGPDHRRRREDDHLPRGHGRLRRRQRRLRPVHAGPAARPLHRRRRRAAQGRPGGDRGDRAASGRGLTAAG